MRFDIITIFPHIFDSYFNESILKRAQAKKLLDIHVHDLRAYTKDKRKKVDDKAYGGGPGMVIKAEPIVSAINAIAKKGKKPLIVITDAAGKTFDAKHAQKFSKEKQIIVVAGHYEGIDARTYKIFKARNYRLQAISIGPYVLTGGEIPAMIMVDAVARYIPGVLGKFESLEEKRHGVGTPTFTRPEVFNHKGKKYSVPKVLLSGDHAKIMAWRQKHTR